MGSPANGGRMPHRFLLVDRKALSVLIFELNLKG